MANPIEIIGLISSIETLEAGFRNILTNSKEHTAKAQTDQNLNLLDIWFREQIQSCIKEESVSEKLDDFLASYASPYKPGHDIDLFSRDERLAFQNEFYHKYPELNASNIDLTPLLDRFLDLLNEALNEKLDYNTKFLSHKMNSIGERLIRQFQDTTVSRNPPPPKSGVRLLAAMEAVLSLIRLHTGHDFDTKATIPPNCLTYSDLDDFVLKAERLLARIDREKIDAVTENDSGTPLESLQMYVSKTAPDLALDLNRFYTDKIVPIVAFLKAYDEKAPEYYWAIGKMDCPLNDYDRILDHLIGSLETLFCCQYECLQNKWRELDYEKMDAETVLRMQQQILEQIRPYLAPPRQPLIRELYDREQITDRELAGHHRMSVEELRHLLYAATKVFLTYEYVDDMTTMLSIKGQYRRAIGYYFEQEATGREM